MTVDRDFAVQGGLSTYLAEMIAIIRGISRVMTFSLNIKVSCKKNSSKKQNKTKQISATILHSMPCLV